MNINEFRGELVTDSIVRLEPFNGWGNAPRANRSTNCRRQSDNKWVIEELCASHGITNIRTRSKEENIRLILAEEARNPKYTQADLGAAPAASTDAAAAVDGNDANCAVINAAEGLRIVKAVVDAPAEGFRPYAVRFTVKSEVIAAKLKDTFMRANSEFGGGSQAWLLRALITAIDAECGCAGQATETITGTATTNDGMIVQKVLLPVAGFQPFSLEFQLPNQALATKFTALMRRADDFCGEANWLRRPVKDVIATS